MGCFTPSKQEQMGLGSNTRRNEAALPQGARGFASGARLPFPGSTAGHLVTGLQCGGGFSWVCSWSGSGDTALQCKQSHAATLWSRFPSAGPSPAPRRALKWPCCLLGEKREK